MNKRYTVFHMVSSLELGGAERVAINIAKSENKIFEYHIVEVVQGHSGFSDALKKELDKIGIKYHTSPIRQNKLAIVLFPFWFFILCFRRSPDIIHVHTEIPDLACSLFRISFGLLTRISKPFPRYIRTIHNTELWGGWKPVGKLVETYYRKHHSNIAISQSTRESYEREYGQTDIPIIYNGLEEVQQKPFEHLVEGKINVLFAGRLEYQKGIEQLISVVEAFQDSTRYHFHIVGCGSNEKRLRMKLGDYANVSLYDKIYGLSAYLKSFDYLFMPSNHEGLALMPIEASLAHTPPIINRCPGLEETLPADWPLAVDNNSVEGFIGIFKNKLKNVDYNNLADKAHRFAKEQFSIEVMQKKYEELYLSESIK